MKAQQDADGIRKNQQALRQQDPDRLELEDSQDDSGEDSKGTNQNDNQSKRTR